MTQLINSDNVVESLFKKLANHIDGARQKVLSTINHEMILVYWNIGKSIVEELQQGEERAEYGEQILKKVSKILVSKYGKGFSHRTLDDARKFYVEYRDHKKISHARAKLENPSLLKNLGWTHYRTLMREKRLDARQFYEHEASQNNWSTRELERQMSSLLYDRLAKSKNKEALFALATKGQEVQTPQDAIKDPIVLEFLALPESNKLVESDLEEALITNLQQFLLELGKGFAFVARQKRLTLDGDHFYANLVFYHVLLKCYIVVDIKVRKLQHSDLGQMQLYVNYFDKEVKTEGDNPTIGLILCTEKNNTMVQYTLGEKAKQIFASKYQFHLPSEEELMTEIKKEVLVLSKN